MEKDFSIWENDYFLVNFSIVSTINLMKAKTVLTISPAISKAPPHYKVFQDIRVCTSEVS